MKISTIPQSLSIWDRLSLCCSYNTMHSSYTLHLVRLLSLCQAFFLFFGNIDPQINQNDFWFHTQVKWLSDLFGVIKASGFLEQSVFASILLCGLHLYLILVVLVIITVVLMNRKTQNFKPEAFQHSRLCSGLTAIHCELLLYPTSVGLVGLLELFADDQFANFPKAVGIILIIILFLLNCLIGVFYTVFCYSPIKFKHIISRKGSFHLLGIIALKVFLPLMQSSVLRNSDTNQNAWKITCVILSLVTMIGSLVYNRLVLPEYNLDIMKMHIIFDTLSATLVISQIFTLFIDDDGSILNLATVVLPVCLLLSWNIYISTMRNLVGHPEKIGNLNYLVHLEILFDHLESSLYSNPTKKMHPSEALEANWFNISTSYADHSSVNQKKKFQLRIKGFLKGQYEKLQAKSKLNNLGTLAYINLLMKRFGLYPKAYSLCVQLLDHKPSTAYRIAVFTFMERLKKNIKKQTCKNDGEGSFSSVIWQDSLAETAFKELQDNLNKFIDESLAFWKTLQANKPNIMTLVTRAKALEFQRNKLESHWAKHKSKFTTRYSLAYLLYGAFESLYMPWEAIQNIEKYRKFIKTKDPSLEITSKDVKSDSAIIMISSDKKNMGHIMNCSDSVGQIFGAGKQDLVGHNINLLMPRFYTARHDQFILNYYETGKSHVMWRERAVYAKDSHDNIFPASLYVAIQPILDKGIMYSALLRRIQDQNEYILLTQDGFIQEVSVGIRAQFNIQPYSKTHIKTICPECTDEYISSLTEAVLDDVEDILEDVEPSDANKTVSRNTSLNGRQVGTFKYVKEGVNRIIKYKISVKSMSYADGSSIKVMSLRAVETGPVKLKSNPQPEVIQKEDDILYDVISADGLSIDFNEKIDQSKYVPNVKFIKSISKESSNLGRQIVKEKTIDGNDSSKKVASKLSQAITTLNSKSNQKRLFSLQSTTTTSSKHAYEKTADRVQKMYQSSFPSVFKRVFKLLFIIVLVISLIMVGMKYLAFRQSIDDIDLAVDVVRNSYQRLIALCWLWRYSINYKGIFQGITTSTVDALNRYKMVIQYNQDLIKTANNNLASALAKGNQEQKAAFFNKDIQFVYDDPNDSLQGERLNSFEAINIFIGKLDKFNVIPTADLMATQNADIDFVRKNIANDLLITSENLIDIFTDSLTQESDDKKNLLRSLLYSSAVITFLAITLVVINFTNDVKKVRKVARTLLAIHPDNVKVIMSNLNSMHKVLLEPGQLTPKNLYALYSQNSHQSAKLNSHIALSREYISRNFFIAKGFRSAVLVILVCCFFLASVLELNLSIGNIDDLLVISNRLIIVPEAWYKTTLTIATLLETLVVQNSTYERHEPIYKQLRMNIDLLVTNDQLYDAFTDKKGDFINSEIEYIFKVNPCPFVTDLPGIGLVTPCIKGTFNQSIGAFAVNANVNLQFSNMAHNLFTGNLTIDQSKLYNGNFSLLISPGANGLIGAYSYINGLVVKEYDSAVTSGLHSGVVRFVYQTVFMVLIAALSIWFLYRKILDDSDLRVLLKAIPAEQFLKNKLINSFIRNLYKGNSVIRNIKLEFS